VSTKLNEKKYLDGVIYSFMNNKNTTNKSVNIVLILIKIVIRFCKNIIKNRLYLKIKFLIGIHLTTDITVTLFIFQFKYYNTFFSNVNFYELIIENNVIII